MVSLDELNFDNKVFWIGFMMTSFPTSLDEETDMTLYELIEETENIDIAWWNSFTKYYDGVFEENDGYVDEPGTLVCGLTDTQTLKIEFHPGDTVFYINDRQIACTGGEYKIGIFPFADLCKYTEIRKDNRIFLLLLPLAVVDGQDTERAIEIISGALKEVFDERQCSKLAGCIVNGLIQE